MGLFGNWFSGWGSAFREQTDASIDRANVMFLMPHDSARYTAPTSRRKVREKYEWVWQNFGLVRELQSGTARQVVGKGIIAQLNSDDSEWNREAEMQVEEWALTPDRCDRAGRRNLYEAQTFAVEQFIGPGEFFSADTDNPRWGGEPCFQIIDPAEIGTPPDREKDPKVLDGVLVDDDYVPQKYFVRTQTGQGVKFEPRDAAGIVHWYAPHTANQVRGVSPFAAALNNLVDVHELKRLTTRTAKAQQLIALVLKGVAKKKSRGAMGAIKNAGASEAGYDASQDNAQLEQLYTGAGAGIAYLDSEGDAKLVQSNSPSPLVEPFITDLLLRDVCLAPGVPMEFFWAPQKLTGANQRFILVKADLFFQLLADALIYRFIRRQIIRFLSWRMENGKLRKCADPQWMNKISFQMPARLSIDNGRDGALEISQLQNNITTLRDIHDKRGGNYREAMRQWVREVLEFIEIAKAANVPQALLDKWVSSLPAWRAHATGAGVAAGPGKPAEKEDDQDPEPQNDKEDEDK